MPHLAVPYFARLVLIACLLWSNITELYSQQYNFRTYSLEEGLPQSQVNALIEDQNGNLWVGTNGGGLCRFNGKEFQIFTKKHGLLDNLVSALHQDQSGTLWVATSNGIAAYDGVSFKYYTEQQGVNEGRYFWINSDESGKIWVHGVENQGSRKILYLENDQFHNLMDDHPELVDDNVVIGGIMDRENRLQIVTKKGLYQYHGGRLEISPLQKLVPSDQVVMPVLNDRKGNLWLASGKFPSFNDLYVLQDDKLTPITLPDGVALSQLRSPFEDSKGNIWSSIDGTGVLKTFFGDAGNISFQVFNRSNGLPVNQINHILEDREGNIWFGSDGGGLIKYSSEKFVALNVDDGLSSEIIWAITSDNHGNYWFGTGGGALIKYDGTNVVNVITEEESTLGFIKKFIRLENGNLLIGSLNGLWEYDGVEFKKVNEKYGLDPTAKVSDIIRDGKEFLISVYGKGVARFDGRETSFITSQKDKIATNSMDHLMKDSKGNIWMASKSMGVSKYQAEPLQQLEPQDPPEGSRVINYDSNNGLNNDYILQIAEDDHGHLWFASYGGGLNIFDGKDFTYLDTEKGLTSDNIYSVIADDEGNIWAGTQNGVDKITLNDQGEIENIVNYDKYDGFTGIETNGMANYKDQHGNLWFGTIKGVMRYKPAADRFNPTPPITNITKLKLFFKDVNWNEENYQKYLSGIQSWHHLPRDLKLPYDLNHVSFNFEALSFQVPEKVQYQWKLEGLDRDWAPVSAKTEAVYPNLAPGSYTFHVKASNNHGVWNEMPASFSFIVDPPWWGTWWFQILLALAVVGTGMTVYNLRIQSIQKKKKELEKMVKQKTKEVVQQKDEILVQSKKLKESYDNLELLSDVGKHITSNLSVSKIIDTVYENVNNLMKAEIFWIGIYDESKEAIVFNGAVEAGERLPTFSCELSENDRLAVWCFKNQQEVYINDYSVEYVNYAGKAMDAIAGKVTHSIIYVPLISKGKTIGVLSVQSYDQGAYDEHHLSLIRNIAVHTKIALENASAYEKITEQSRGLLHQKEQIQSKNQELLELNQEKNHLIGIVAHDLRNPLTSALTIGGLLKTGPELTEEQEEYADHILNAMERMNQMVNRILDIKAIESKSVPLNLEKTNLVEVFQEVHDNFKDALRKKELELQIKRDHLEPMARVDRNYLTQIYENLVSNAIKFSPPRRLISVEFQKNNGHIETEIRDQGPGLTSKDMDLLFRKYQTLSARPTAGEQSTGLGLSIVKKYVEAMGGKVWAESIPGEGAIFKVQFADAK